MQAEAEEGPGRELCLRRHCTPTGSLHPESLGRAETSEKSFPVPREGGEQGR